MGCCVSKKRSEPLGVGAGEALPRRVEARDLPPQEEEKVKEVLSETPSTKPRLKPRRVAGAVAPSVERGAVAAPEKAKPKGGGARVKDGGATVSRAVRLAHAAEEMSSEVASESSAATTAAGPERSPAKPPRRQGTVSGELRRARRDRAAAVPGGVGRPGGRASPSPPPPPPRRDSGERPGRRSPSPAAKRSQDQRRDTAASSCTQRKPPVPARPCSRASPRRAREAPSQLPPAAAALQPHEPTHCASPPPPQARAQEDTAGGGNGAGDGEGKDSLENPLVSMECFIFL